MWVITCLSCGSLNVGVTRLSWPGLACSFSKFRNQGSDKLKDSFGVSPRGTGRWKSSYSQSRGLSLGSKASTLGGLKLLQELQEWTCSVDLFSLCILKGYHAVNCMFAKFETSVFFFGIVRTTARGHALFQFSYCLGCALCSGQKYNTPSITKRHVIMFFCSFET